MNTDCPTSSDFEKPAGYPLPWCDALGVPYWKVNAMLCQGREGWGEHQKHRSMAELIPEIDSIIEEMGRG